MTLRLNALILTFVLLVAINQRETIALYIGLHVIRRCVRKFTDRR